MAILAGIDEAGFSPVLGPMVVAVGVFRLSEDALDQCLWRKLSSAVTRKGFRKSSALGIADSKQMHVRNDGVIHLERGLLGMLLQQGSAPRTLLEFLKRTAPHVPAQMQEYPWYRDADLPLPRQADWQDLMLRANALTEAMKRHEIRFEGLHVEPVLEGHYNRLVAATRNKSVALFGIAGKLIDQVCRQHDDGELIRLIVDHQGGRVHYLGQLQKIFDGGKIRILEESPTQSSYFIQHGSRRVEIHFQVSGEEACMATALASMACKFTRELFMELLNAWWGRLVPDLVPTAGYQLDGKRFLKQIAPAIAQTGIDKSMLVRCW